MAFVNFGTASSLFPAGSQAQNATPYYSADQKNAFRRGAIFYVNITAGTGTITLTVQGKDPISGQYFNLPAFASVSGVGQYALVLYPGAGGGTPAAVSSVLPETWRVSALVGTAAVTATIGASEIV